MGLSIEVREAARLHPLSYSDEETIDLLVREETSVSIDHFPPLTFFFEPNMSLVVDGKVHPITIKFLLRRWENFFAAEIELLDRKRTVDIRQFLRKLFFVGDMRP